MIHTECKPISEVQRMQLELLRTVCYNELDGALVVDDLLAWRDLWYGVLGDRFALARPSDAARLVIDLIKLRDLPSNYWNVDTVFIWTAAAHVETLTRRIAERWRADEVGVFDDGEASRTLGYGPLREARLIYAWWD
jgi:hypothetical protein